MKKRIKSFAGLLLGALFKKNVSTIFILLFVTCISLVVALDEKKGADSVNLLSNNVLIIYNDQDPESIEVADYYALKRNIPSINKCKLSIPSSKTNGITIADFETLIKSPTRACLDRVGRDNIYYIVMSYKLPYTVSGAYMPILAPEGILADVWDQVSSGYYWSSTSPYFANSSSKANIYTPFVSFKDYRSWGKDIYSVWRLDAGTKEKAKGLIDRAMYAEQNGLSGQGCFDTYYFPAASLPTTADSGSNGMGDWDTYRASGFVRMAGFPSTLNDGDHNTVHSNFGAPGSPLNRCDGAAFYGGWYNYNNYIDAFTWAPGSVGWDINSAGATSPRRGSNWCFNAIDRGLTACTGSITEPYFSAATVSDGTFRNLFEGANVGDAIYRNTQMNIKWVMLYIGDPLYRPFPNGRAPFNKNIPSAPTKLVISGTKTVKSGLCTGLSVNTSDPNSNISLINKSITVNLSTNNGKFYSDGNCTKESSALQIGLSSINPTIYFKASGPSEAIISASTNEPGLSGVSFSISISEPFPLSTPYHEEPYVANQLIQAMEYDKGGSSSAFYDLTALDDVNHDRFANSLPLLRPEEDWVEICAVSSTYICSSKIDTSYSVGGTYSGEWINYSLNLEPGRYKISSTVSSNGPGGKYHFELSENIVTEQIIVPDTTAWNNYINIDSSEFDIVTSGTYRMKLVFDANGSWTDSSGASRANIVGRFSTFKVVSLSSDQAPTIGTIPDIHAYPNMSETVKPSVANGTTYLWSIKTLPTGGSVTFAPNNTLITSISANFVGNYVVVLTASNTIGSNSEDANLIVHKLADIDNTGTSANSIDFQDFSMLLRNWGTPSNTLANIDRSGASANTVDFQDFTALLGRWGN